MTIRFVDELENLPQRSNKIFDELVELDSDLRRVSDGYTALKIAARDFTPKLDQDGIANQSTDPAADVAFVQHKVRMALANLDKSIPLISQRRDAIAALLR